MKKLLAIVVLIALSVAGFGCEPQRSPAPDPQERIIPQESTIGYRQVDLDQTPASIQRIASTMEGRQMMTWAYDDGNSYVLINLDQEEQAVKVHEIIQRVPRQDFLWLHIKLVEDEQENNNQQDLIVIRLEDTDKSIDGVGFELRASKEEPAPDNNGTTQAPAARAPVTPAPAARKPAPRPAPAEEREAPGPAREVSPEREQPQDQNNNENQNNDANNNK